MGRILVVSGHLNEDEVVHALGLQLALPVRTDLRTDEIDATLIERVPITFAKEHVILPLHRDDRDAVRVAVADPFDTAPLDDLRLLFDGAEIAPELASRRTILGAINQAYDRSAGSAAVRAAEAAEDLDALATEISHEPQDLLEAGDEAPIIRLVNSLLQEAVKERASDIHLEPFDDEVRVRFRIDDILREPIPPLPRALHSSIVSRIKIMGGLNIAEKRLPQGGRIRLKIAGRDYDVRLSTVPVVQGERVVLRLLPRDQEMLSLERLGFSDDELVLMERMTHRTTGIVLVTGPTGSGKTTTLYATLARINTTDKSIITLDDPVEIQLPGVGQIEVKEKIGLTFAAGLREILRQNPNVILVGEIRDLETAETAIQASLTGHLVFSTLHTNDAPSAITRLVDQGVEPYLIASSLVAVLAQRLVRILCPECKEAYDPAPEELAELGLQNVDRPVRIYRAKGCPRCHHQGYHGRVGIFEMMVVDDAIRRLIISNVDAKTIRERAVAAGMRTLRMDGARKVLRGITSVAEVLRATEEDSVST
ncbi:MAG: type II secretion system ATPase GspE [Deltaproteobacteria bacterium]|nr:MAG: type II secretion system ATPase GspE [Deltaproteobacteria bacterium]